MNVVGRRPGSRHAEVAGAGLGGLSVATALALTGWTVRVHERAPDLRMFGAGIWLWENGLLALRVLGAASEATSRARQIKQWAVVDEHGRDVFRREFTSDDQMVLPLRADLYQALITCALEAGVEIVTNSAAVGATPSGELILTDDTRHRADLVVAADGAFSRIRDGLMMTDRVSYLREGYIRLTIPVRPGDEDAVITECWNGSRRLLYCPCTDAVHYVGLTCAVTDTIGRAVPVDQASWSASFPAYAEIISRAGDVGRWDRGMTVRCNSWSQGNVVVVGDAAHAQAPNLGQGANITFTNAVSLAAALSDAADIPQALCAWESRERPLTNHVQRWSQAYGLAVSRWLAALSTYRAPALQALTSIPFIDQQLNRAARHRPASLR